MRIHVESRPLEDMAVIVPEVYQDARGFFMETYRADQFRDLGLPVSFAQDNHSRSVKGAASWAALSVGASHGQVDARAIRLRLSGGGRHPQGFAHARALGGGGVFGGKPPPGLGSGGVRPRIRSAPEMAEIQYKCTGMYNSKAESGIRWNDPAIGIEWPVADPILSEKDTQARTLADWLASPDSDRFLYHPEPEAALALG